jgi:small subunit ribosomal protein S20
MLKILLLGLLAASASAFSAVAMPVRAAAPCRAAAVMSTVTEKWAPPPKDAEPVKKYTPSSDGVNPRVFKDRRSNVYNRYYKSTQTTALKKVNAAMATGDKAEALKLFSVATSVIDKNVKRGIIHRNKGARNKSRTQKRISAMAAAN